MQNENENVIEGDDGNEMMGLLSLVKEEMEFHKAQYTDKKREVDELKREVREVREKNEKLLGIIEKLSVGIVNIGTY